MCVHVYVCGVCMCMCMCMCGVCMCVCVYGVSKLTHPRPSPSKVLGTGNDSEQKHNIGGTFNSMCTALPGLSSADEASFTEGSLTSGRCSRVGSD